MTAPELCDVELFAGPGGWSEGRRMAGATLPHYRLEHDETACQTAEAAGHPTICADVAAYPTAEFEGRTCGLIASPPCPSFSPGGKRGGLSDLPNVLQLISDYAADREPAEYPWVDERSALTAQPMRWAMALRPQWIACEQVPAVLPIWQHLGQLLRLRGYRTWCGVLNAEEHGVPQVRARAILLASLDGKVAPPAPLHRAYPGPRGYAQADDLFTLPVPVSMADALGWDPEELVGFPRRADGVGATVMLNGSAYRARDLRPATFPSQAVTEKVRSWKRYRTGVEPARVTVQEASLLQSFPVDYPWHGTPTQQFRQIGDAVPPRLAAAVLAPFVAASCSLDVAA